MAAGVSLLSDLPHDTTTTTTAAAASSRELSAHMEPVSVRVPTAKYTKVGETLRSVIPGHMQCSMACGGRACKYENPSRWSAQEQAIKGLYSSWITDNLLAMARPSTEIIEKYNIIEQFLACGLRSVINLQRPGEHASCGYPLEPESGFTYRPEVFMEAGIYFYNFGWKDYGVASLTTVLDMVKVMAFAVQEGKMAIHCHAGLGRTGVLLACYLVFRFRMSADQAILFVRAKRPSSIQTRGQLLCVREFAQFLAPLRGVFPSSEPAGRTLTLSQYLVRQRHLLHGYEARQMKNVPKIVHVVCGILLAIAEGRQAAGGGLDEAPDLAAEVDKTVSREALQQLGKEMMGKGIPMPRPSQPSSLPLAGHSLLPAQQDSELLRRWQGAPGPQRSLRRGLSCSDSALHTLGSRGQLTACPPRPISEPLNQHCVSQSSLAPEFPGPQNSRAPVTPKSCNTLTRRSPTEETERGPRRPAVVEWVPPKGTQRSRSLSPRGSSAVLLAASQTAEEGRECAQSNRHQGAPAGTSDEPERVGSVVPFLMLQSDLTPEARHALVLKALAVDPDDEHLRNSILLWQMELNSRDGAWERLRLQWDPLLLSALMWSWLEQLKEPVLTREDVEVLIANSHSPLVALDAIDKDKKQTLFCVLDCVAHLAKSPDEIETAVLRRTIGAFTRYTTDSECGKQVYDTLSEILTLVLNDIRRKAAGELETSCHCT
ncbi:protein tyrosine phosphatase domain-containing protein 1 [Electrophorus electricus]|uniref:protein tyrosine phosphatase domain-containing protein 1 n=1 Tax=Electrophorus electricus TaxID=8005 RepID=UPI0015D0359C|nr:protein tyrosine phosphatase domain-containing protein 1 [Electrophorus electricus]